MALVEPMWLSLRRLREWPKTELKVLDRICWVKVNLAREDLLSNKLILGMVVKSSKAAISNLKLTLNGRASARKSDSFVLK